MNRHTKTTALASSALVLLGFAAAPPPAATVPGAEAGTHQRRHLSRVGQESAIVEPGVGLAAEALQIEPLNVGPAAQEAGRAPTETQRAARAALAKITESGQVRAWPSLLDDPGYRHHPFELGPMSPDSAPRSAADQLRRSACASDAVVVARISNPSAFLTEDAKYILTEYDLAVLQTVRGSLRNDEAASYVRPGGKLMINGRLAEVADDAAPTLRTDTDYLLFLKRVPGLNPVFTPVFIGPEARWVIDAIALGAVATTSSPWSLAELRAGMDPDTVKAIVGAAACR